MAENRLGRIKIVVIGGSAGALDVVLKTLSNVEKDFSFTIVVVLHRANNQESTLADVLEAKSKAKVKEIEDKEPLLPGTIYLVPADYHVLVEKSGIFSLDASEKVNYSRPSIDVTFESIAENFGRETVAILLSGGNNDGTAGLLAIKNAGGTVCVQDPETAAVAYMPQGALAVLKVDRILKPLEIGGYINALNKNKV